MGPLANLKVIEMVGLGPAPLAGQLLSDLGADVIVVDRTSGKTMKREVNRRGKRSIALDLKHPRGVVAVMKLVAKSDVLIEGFRPGVMERLGLGPEQCLAANSRLVYGRMTGWGQEGPLAKTSGHDLNYLAITGALHAMGKANEPPLPPLNLVADYGGGTMFLLLGILAALHERTRSGRGQVIDAAMIDGVPAMMAMLFSGLAQGTWSAERENNYLDGAAPYYRCYKTSDDRFISVAALEPQFFEELVTTLQLDPALADTRLNKRQWPELAKLFTDIFAGKTRDEWASLFEGNDACVAPVLTFEEAANYPHNVIRAAYFTSEDVTQPVPAPRFSRSRPEQPQPGEATGMAGKNILTDLGYSAEEIAMLENEGVLL